jgi:DNA-binding Lrp family transcriptional regulator
VTEPPLRGLATRIEASGPAIELDAIDTRLLIELAKDARVPQRKLAEMLGMSSPAVADRIARLKSRGVIRGFSVDIGWDRLGNSTVAFLSIVAAMGQDQNSVIEQLVKVRGVEEISVVTGSTDMLVKIRTRGFDDLRTILATDIWNIEGVQKTETSISLIRVEPEGVTERMLNSMPGHGQQEPTPKVSARDHGVKPKS